MINNRRTICILGGTGTVGVTACKVLSKLGYSLRVSVRNIETIKDTGMYMAPNIQLFELDIDKESNIGKFFKGSDLVIGAIGPSADYSEKMLLEAMAENIPYVDPGGIHLIRKMRNSSMKGTAIVGSGIFPGLSGWMLSSVLKEAFKISGVMCMGVLGHLKRDEQEKLLYKLDKNLNINVPILIELLEPKFLVAPVGSRISVATQGRLRYETYITDIKQVGMDQWTWRLTYKVFCGKNIVSTVDSLMSWNYQSVEKILNQLTKMHFRTAKLSETLLLAIKAR